MIKCKKCKILKNLDQFYKSTRHKNGLNPKCINCVKEYNNLQHEKHKESRNECKKKYYHLTKNQFKSKRKQYTIKNREHKAEYDKEYRKLNQKKLSKQKYEWEKQQVNNIEFKIKRNLRRRIHHALNGNNKSENTIKLLGCSIEDFIKHIENQFEDGMSWDNYGTTGWHIDHIKPCYSFDLTDPKQQKECFHYSNQRPLWAKDNLTRSRI